MDILVIITTLVLSAFFSGMEIAYVSSNKVYLTIEKKQNTFIANILTKLTEKPSMFITSMLVGNNVVLVIYGYYSGDLLMQWIETLSFEFSSFAKMLLQTLLSTIIILFTAEFLPKVFFQIYVNSLIKLFALPAYIFYVLFYGVT